MIRSLSQAGIPVRVMFSPVIPFVNDAELERVLETAAEAGACVLLRLPYELKDLFRGWLQVGAPLKAARVMSLITSRAAARTTTRSSAAAGAAMASSPS